MKNLYPGFAEAAFAQACFRAVLKAMSFPGRPVDLGIALTAPPGLSPAAAALLLTLADPSVAVHLQDPRPADWLVFHAGTRLTTEEQADFLVATTRPRLAEMATGSDDEPQNGATLILEVAALDIGRRVRLTGPGIESELVVELPLDADFCSEWETMAALAPRGVDVLLCAGDRIVALPRSVKLEAA